jgi:twinfilin-like protein
LDAEKASFVLYRMDSGDQWLLLCYVLDKAKVKDKMLYASTRANLKQQLGLNYFIDEVFGTVSADFTLQAYKKHLEWKKAEAPLTEQEIIKKNELESGPVYSGGKSTYVHGVAFPVDAPVMDALQQLKSGKVNYVQIAIDIEKEKIILDHSGKIGASGLSDEISTEVPRFHFFNYQHNFEGNDMTSTVFVFSCPDGSKGTKSAPVKQRMLYSSSKENVANIFTSNGGKIEAKLEINTPDDITEEIVMNTLHPPKEEKKAAFSKPLKPGKGGRTLIKK